MPVAATQADLFCSSLGVRIYHSYRNDRVEDGRREYIFSLNPDNNADNSFDPTWDFDVRDLPEWDRFFNRRSYSQPDEPRVIRTAIERAIYTGHLTAAGVRLKWPLRHNHAFDLAFAVVTDNDPDQVTAEELFAGLEARLESFRQNPQEIIEACGYYGDSYENEPYEGLGNAETMADE